MPNPRTCKHCGSVLPLKPRRQREWRRIALPVPDSRYRAWREYAGRVRLPALSDLVGVVMGAWVQGLLGPVDLRPVPRGRPPAGASRESGWATKRTLHLPTAWQPDAYVWRDRAAREGVAFGRAIAAVVDAWVASEESDSPEQQRANWQALQDAVSDIESPAGDRESDSAA